MAYKQCGRCNKIWPAHDEPFERIGKERLELRSIYYGGVREGIKVRYINLCPECRDNLMNWFKETNQDEH